MSEAIPEQPTHIDDVETTSPPPFDPERIIAELDAAFGRLPEAAIRESREHRDEMVPRLIQTIRDATVTVRAGGKGTGNAHFFALFMLTEFKAREALPVILEAMSLPDDAPYNLFGDAKTAALAEVLVRLSDNPLAVIDGLIQNAAVDEYVRWEAAHAYAHLVRDGRLRREEAVEHLRRNLRQQIDAADESLVVSGLIDTLADLWPREAYEEIKEAYREGRVDESIIGIEDVDREIAAGEAGVQNHLDRLRALDDTIAELRKWASFKPEPAAKLKLSRKPIAWPTDRSAPKSARRASAPASAIPAGNPVAAKRAGRNDPCPCGSGKKYKKCCLAKDENR